MNSIEQKKQAKAFAERWAGKGYEKGESQRYWIDLLSNVFTKGTNAYVLL